MLNFSKLTLLNETTYSFCWVWIRKTHNILIYFRVALPSHHYNFIIKKNPYLCRTQMSLFGMVLSLLVSPVFFHGENKYTVKKQNPCYITHKYHHKIITTLIIIFQFKWNPSRDEAICTVWIWSDILIESLLEWHSVTFCVWSFW